MDKHIYSNIGELFKMVYNLLNSLEAKNYKKFFNNYWGNDIYEIEEKASDIIQKIQVDNEEIIENR